MRSLPCSCLLAVGGLSLSPKSNCEGCRITLGMPAVQLACLEHCVFLSFIFFFHCTDQSSLFFVWQQQLVTQTGLSGKVQHVTIFHITAQTYDYVWLIIKHNKRRVAFGTPVPSLCKQSGPDYPHKPRLTTSGPGVMSLKSHPSCAGEVMPL